jgi:hypothetical protein
MIMASSAFTKAVAGKKRAMQKMKEVERNTFQQPTIEDGTYILGVTGECGVTEEKGVPYVRLDWVIQDEGPENGKGYQTTFWLENEDQEKEDKQFEILAKALLAILDVEEVNVEDAVDIEQYVDVINQGKSFVRTKIVTKESANGKKYINTYFQRRVEVV